MTERGNHEGTTPIVSGLSTREEYVQRAIRSIERVRMQSTNTSGEYSNVVGISGARGVGKSTLLQYACKRLRRSPADIVLDIITPSDLGSAKSLFVLVLMALKLHLEDFQRVHRSEREVHKTAQEFHERLVSILLDATRSTRAYLPNIQSAAQNADEFGWQMVQGERSAYQAKRDFAQWLPEFLNFQSGFVTKRQEAKHPLLIVPLDDFDLSPELLPSTIEDIGRFLSGLRVAVLLAFTDDAMIRAVSHRILFSYVPIIDRLEQMHLWNPAAVSREVDDFIAKFVPDPLRVQLPQWEKPIEKMLFRPPEGGATILELMSSIRLAEHYRVSRFSDFFDLSNAVFLGQEQGNVIPSYFVSILPSSARGLSHLHEVLLQIVEQHDSSEPLNGKEVFSLLKTFTGICVGDLPHQDRVEWADAVIFRPDGRIEFNFMGLEWYYKRGNRATILKRDSHAYIRPVIQNIDKFTAKDNQKVRQIGNVLSVVDDTASIDFSINYIESFLVRRKTGEKSEDQKGREVSYLLLAGLVRIFTEADEVLRGPQAYSFGFPSYNFSHILTNVSFDGKKTDSLSVGVPDWLYYLPYFIVAKVWNTWTEDILAWDEDAFRVHIENTLLLDFFCVQNLLLILYTNSGTRIMVRRLGDLKQAYSSLKGWLEESKNELAEKVRELAGGAGEYKFRTHHKLLREFAICAIHATNRLAASQDLMNWLCDNVIKPCNAALAANERASEIWETVGGRPTFDAPDSPAGCSLISDLLETLFKVDKKLFEKIAEDIYSRWEAIVLKRAKGQYAIVQQLQEQKLISESEADTMLDKGLTAAIRAKLTGLLKPQNMALIEQTFQVALDDTGKEGRPPETFKAR